MQIISQELIQHQQKRQKRQLVIIGIITVTSTISIYSVSQLTIKASTDDRELITPRGEKTTF